MLHEVKHAFSMIKMHFIKLEGDGSKDNLVNNSQNLRTIG